MSGAADDPAITFYPVAAKGAGTCNGSDYEQLGYDANGNVTSFRARANDTIAFTYDALNRQTLKRCIHPDLYARFPRHKVTRQGRVQRKRHRA